ncbi:MAG TPA: hypothetical protein DER40_06400 [Geobacter sp.]|nr:hypothetical protein [Geobacter sp.]HCE67148.1 hypothetical protein [Geobacter sp.]
MLFITKFVITALFAYLWYKLVVLHKATDTEVIIGLVCIIIAYFVSRGEWKIFGKEINKKVMSKFNLVSEKKWWEFWK